MFSFSYIIRDLRVYSCDYLRTSLSIQRKVGREISNKIYGNQRITLGVYRLASPSILSAAGCVEREIWRYARSWSSPF